MHEQSIIPPLVTSPTASVDHSPEDRPDVDHPGGPLAQLPGNAHHQRHHALVRVVVPRDHPHHPQRVHQRGERVHHDGKAGPVGYVLEVALQGAEELDVVLRLQVVLAELRAVVLEVGVGGDVGEFQNGQHVLDGSQFQLLIERGKHRVALLPEINLGQRPVSLRLLLELLVDHGRYDPGPPLHGGLQLGDNGAISGHHRRLLGDDNLWDLQLHLSLHLLDGALDLRKGVVGRINTEHTQHTCIFFLT